MRSRPTVLAVVLALLMPTLFPNIALADDPAGRAPLYDTVLFTCGGGAIPVNGETFGFAVLNVTADGDVIAEVAVKGGAPNSTYALFVNQDLGGCPTVATGTLTTNDQGNGNGQVTVPLVLTATNFWVSAVGGAQVLRSTSFKIRALIEDTTTAQFTCPGGGWSLSSETFGFFALNLTPTDVNATVSVKGGLPNTTYSIYVNQDPGGCPTTASGTLTTNAQGNGTGHVTKPRVLTAMNFWVSADAFPAQTLRTPAIRP